MKNVLLFLLPLVSAFCTEHHFDITPSVGGRNSIYHGSVEFDYRLVVPDMDSALIMNAKFKPHTNGNISSALGLGVRGEVGSSLIGFFLYGGHTYVKGANLFQAGPSWEFLGKRLDVRVNGYFPITKSVEIGRRLVEPNFRVEGEVTYKAKYAHFGLLPSYDISSHSKGLSGRIGVPTGIGLLDFIVGRDATFGNFGKVCLTIASFGPASNLSSPVRRQTECFYKFERIKAKPAPKGPIIIIGEPLPEPGKEVPPMVAATDQPVENPPKPSWYDYFFRRG